MNVIHTTEKSLTGQQLVEQGSATLLLHEIVEARVRDTPDKTAVSTSIESVSYAELDRRANQLAHRLQALGVVADTLVGLCIDRSADLVVAMLGILKAGGAYVPIDPSYPSNRIQFLIEDSAVAIVVTVSRVADCLGNCSATVLEMNRDPLLSAMPTTSIKTTATEDNLAYVIYTSGSTGSPKGVLVEHRNVIRLFEQTQHWFAFDRRDVWTMFHSIGFDFSVWEIWGALLYGGELIIVPYDITRSPREFLALLIDKGVTVLNQTPSAFRQLIAAEAASGALQLTALRLIVFGGESLDIKMLEPWMRRYGDQHPMLVNMYGITETTVHVTYRHITKKDFENSGVSPIGVPIPDLELHLLDDAGNLISGINVPGELYVSGPGVTRGYLNRPDLTALRFVPSPNGASRTYRTGDRAMRLENGEYIYLGRADEQLKVRGFRIEPQEIESCLNMDTRLSATLVAARDYGDGDVRLVAYLVPQLGIAITSEFVDTLRDDLAGRVANDLPLHMRPSAYVVLSELPMTAHGKVDRTALPSPSTEMRAPQPRPEIHMTRTEHIVAGICKGILEINEIGPQDDFFEIGGTSLALIRVMGAVNERFRTALDMSSLSEGATVKRLAGCIDTALNNRQQQLEEA